jgi:hypothetical protein
MTLAAESVNVDYLLGAYHPVFIRARGLVDQEETLMWVLTDIADWYDRERASNARFLENAANNTDDDLLGALAWTGIGLARVLNTGAGGFAAGFVDVLRIGDGVKEGGWGYGKDALRALALAGPTLRVGRYALGLVAAVDATPAVGNCAWVAASRAARMTGTQHFATVGSLAKTFGLGIQDTGDLGLHGVQQIIQAVGGEAKLLGSVSSFAEVETIARANPDAVVIFPVRFMRSVTQGISGASVQSLEGMGHALIAKNVGGVVFIVDRSGKVYRSLDALAKVYQAEQSMGMTIHAQAGILVVKNSRVIGGISFVSEASSILNLIAYEMRVVPNPLYNGGAGRNIYLKLGIENIYGWWWFNMDGGIWCYYFGRNKTARWYDINNHRNGQGKWAEKDGFIEVVWGTNTREKWPFEIVPSNQKGSSTTASGKTSEFRAVRVWDADIAKIRGRWKMNCDKWIWNIDFAEDGGLKWSDYYNASMNGVGTWHLTKDGVYAMWASGSRDDWTFSSGGDAANGKTTVAGKLYPFYATKTG